MPDNEKMVIIKGLLTDCAEAVVAELEENGIGAQAAFAIVLWPLGEPEHCSTICGGADERAKLEMRPALISSYTKTKKDIPDD